MVMACAIYFAHWGRNFFGVNGAELAAVLLVGALAVAVGGPGKPSFDQLSRAAAPLPPAPVPKGRAKRGKSAP